MTTIKTAFLGLGVMGYPMAGHLQAKGYETSVYNRTTAKAEAWVKQHGGSFGATPAQAVKEADVVCLCVGNDDDLRSVVLGEEGALAGMKPGAILIDHTTASAEVAREIASVATEKGFSFLDAPVSGGQAGAENGVLTVMVGGDESVFDCAKPVMSCYGKAVTLMGPVGAGQITKMVNQTCVAGVLQGLSEGLAFAQKAGLDGNLVLDVISKGAAQSWQMENRGRTMLEGKFDYGFALDWMIKDLKIVLSEAAKNGASMPGTETILGYYEELSAQGDGRMDTSALIKRL
ncbi:MAG: NAD(P)-dependent oxidoreductase [Magnetovibrionaceae bacterium]